VVFTVVRKSRQQRLTRTHAMTTFCGFWRLQRTKTTPKEQIQPLTTLY